MGSTPNRVLHTDAGFSILEVKRNNGEVLHIVIDTADYELVRAHRWHAKKDDNTFYAQAHIGAGATRTTIFMHGLLLPEAPMVDHRDGNGLNNQRSNIRVATVAQNQHNRKKQDNGITSRFIGVEWNKQARKFRARIKTNDTRLYLGSFLTEEEAALAYNAAAKEHHGEFARLNDVQPAHLKQAA